MGSYRGYIRVWFRVCSPLLIENQRKKNMENEMEAEVT